MVVLSVLMGAEAMHLEEVGQRCGNDRLIVCDLLCSLDTCMSLFVGKQNEVDSKLQGHNSSPNVGGTF